MTIFSAIAIPQNAIDQIKTQLAPLYKDYPDFVWVPPRNFHISLHYIGDINPDKLPIAVEHIENKLYDVPMTHMYTLGADLFIDEQIFLYIAFRRNKIVEDISRRLYDMFEEGSLKKRKKYMPHISIGRYKLPSKQQYFLLQKKLSRLDIDVEFPVEEIHLFEIDSTPKNPVYKKVASIPLLKEE